MIIVLQGANAECTNKDGLSCIYVAIKNKRAACIPVLVEAGVDINMKGPSSMYVTCISTPGITCIDKYLDEWQ